MWTGRGGDVWLEAWPIHGCLLMGTPSVCVLPQVVSMAKLRNISF